MASVIVVVVWAIGYGIFITVIWRLERGERKYHEERGDRYQDMYREKVSLVDRYIVVNKSLSTKLEKIHKMTKRYK